MTTERNGESHPSDVELAAWVDDPERGEASVPAHLGGCARCRENLAEIEATRAAIALDPPMPSAADFAAQRERILEAIEQAPRGGGRIVRRIAWLVPLAAAAVLAIVLMDRANPPAPVPAGEGIFAEADAAAEEAAALANGGQSLDAALAESDASLAPTTQRALAIEDEFTLLTEAEQSAVLRELERTDFEL